VKPPTAGLFENRPGATTTRRPEVGLDGVEGFAVAVGVARDEGGADDAVAESSPSGVGLPPDGELPPQPAASVSAATAAPAIQT